MKTIFRSNQTTVIDDQFEGRAFENLSFVTWSDG